MNKAANIYWTKARTKQGRLNGRNTGGILARAKSAIVPNWIAFTIFVSITAMVMLTINLKANSVWRAETQAKTELENQVQAITSENLALQEEIYYLKNDPSTVESESKKFGLIRPKE